MKQSLRLGRIAGIPVGVNWSVFVILALVAEIIAADVLPQTDPGRPVALYWFVAVPTAVVFLASLLAHELAHAVMARRKGVGVRSITLWMLGGVAQLDGEPPNARADFSIAVAGPLTSLAAGIVFMLAAQGAILLGAPPLLSSPLGWAGVMNLLLAVFNVLPGAPLDGGRILRALVWMRTGDRSRADRAATTGGQLLGMTLIVAGGAELLFLRQMGGLWLGLVGWFLILTAGAEARTRVVRDASAGMTLRELMEREPDCAPAWIPVGDFIGAVAVHSRQSVFPVTGFDGAPQGILTLALLSRLPAGRTADRVDSVALALPDGYTAGPDDPVVSLLGRPPLAGVLLAIVVENGRVTGMVTADDLGRLVQQSALRGKTAPSPAPEPAPSPAEHRRI